MRIRSASYWSLGDRDRLLVTSPHPLVVRLALARLVRGRAVHPERYAVVGVDSVTRARARGLVYVAAAADGPHGADLVFVLDADHEIVVPQVSSNTLIDMQGRAT